MPDRELKIKFEKTSDFRTALATGVYGGLNANGLININFFCDTFSLPNTQTITVNEVGKQIGNPRDFKDCDIYREIAFAAMMDINTAKIVIEWIQGRIKEYEQIVNKKI
jgi:hypothetical protein